MTILEKFPGEKGRAERMAGVQQAVSGCPEVLVPLMAMLEARERDSHSCEVLCKDIRTLVNSTDLKK